MAEHHTALTLLSAPARIAYTTLGNYLVGLTPEENHWRKGEARFLTYSDDPRVRPHLAWCYAQGVPGVIPANALLTVEIEVVSERAV